MPHQKVARRAMLVFVLTLLGLVSNAPATLLPFASAAPSLTATPSLYLPIVFHRPPAPQLLAPATGPNTSLAPMLSWTLPLTGTYQVQLATEDTFATTILNKTLKYTSASDHIGMILSDNNNLDQSRTFFWRVGVLFNENIFYSPVGTFTTPKEDATALPHKPRIAGADPLTTTVELTWEAVPGALYYRVSVDTHQRFGIVSALIQAPKTDVRIENLVPKTSYTWRVRALNAAGWGKDADGSVFITHPLP